MIVDFDQKLTQSGLGPLRAEAVTTLQVNVGKLCNQACSHCHVDAGPNRTEIMSRETAELVVSAIRRWRFPVVDITGGAPELNAEFEYLVDESLAAGARVMVRHNLTVQFSPGKENLPEWFAGRRLEVVASLPYFLAPQTNSQRGAGVFEKSLSALRRLNGVGYEVDGSGLILNLVYNPAGAFLPPPQAAIERDFRRELGRRYGISFNSLYTIANMPINRFRHFLEQSGNYERYMERLAGAFNPATVSGLMCRSMLSISWDGRLYDCDFNQMLDLPLAEDCEMTVADLDMDRLARRPIATGRHCLGCTAGAG